MKTQVVLASYETASYFVFPAQCAVQAQTQGVRAMLPTIFEWEPHSAAPAAGALHVHIFLHREAPPWPALPGEEPGNNPVIAGPAPA